MENIEAIFSRSPFFREGGFDRDGIFEYKTYIGLGAQIFIPSDGGNGRIPPQSVREKKWTRLGGKKHIAAMADRMWFFPGEGFIATAGQHLLWSTNIIPFRRTKYVAGGIGDVLRFLSSEGLLDDIDVRLAGPDHAELRWRPTGDLCWVIAGGALRHYGPKWPFGTFFDEASSTRQRESDGIRSGKPYAPAKIDTINWHTKNAPIEVGILDLSEDIAFFEGVELPFRSKDLQKYFDSEATTLPVVACILSFSIDKYLSLVLRKGTKAIAIDLHEVEAGIKENALALGLPEKTLVKWWWKRRPISMRDHKAFEAGEIIEEQFIYYEDFYEVFKRIGKPWIWPYWPGIEPSLRYKEIWKGRR